MTTTTKCNAIIESGIVLIIVNMMNIIAVFIANCTSKVVALTNKALKFSIESWRIWFERFTIDPRMAFHTNSINGITLKRTIFISAAMRTRCYPNKRHSTISTDTRYPFLSGFVMAFTRAKNTACVRTMNFKASIAQRTHFCFRSALPKMRLLPGAYCPRVTRLRTIFGSIFASFVYLIGYTTLVAYFSNHNYLNGVSRQASQYCCSGNTGRAGYIRNKKLTTAFA